MVAEAIIFAIDGAFFDSNFPAGAWQEAMEQYGKPI
jgi:beta-phosphoglucomutase-like phosphatase (HAD superfamily)